MNDELKSVLLPVFQKAQTTVSKTAYWCMCPGCCRMAILSHSQQKSRALESIARNGKVYSTSNDIARRVARSFAADDWDVEVRLTEIAAASTYSGFCNAHDTELFRSIDRGEYKVGDGDQIHQLYLRALSYELSRQRMAIDFRREFVDGISEKNVSDSVCDQVASIVDGYIAEIREKQLLWDSDIHHYWIPFWQFCGAYRLEWCWRTLNVNLGISMSSVFSPISEKQTAHYFNEHHCLSPRPITTFSVIPDGLNTQVVMVWPAMNRKFMDGMMRAFLSSEENVFMSLLNECVFVKSEDYCVSPNLWDSLSEDDKNYVRFTTRHEYYRGAAQRIPEIVKWRGISKCLSNIQI